MVHQPELGRRIAELRKAKNLTQEELVEKCNLSVRTLQRIESGEVTPRSYTVRTIFSALDYNVDDLAEAADNKPGITGLIKKWLEQLYRYIIDLFNLKTHTMRKIMILSVPFLTLFAILLSTGLDANAQSDKKAEKSLEELNANFMIWFNAGKIDSVGLLYLENACMIPDDSAPIIGRENIKGYYWYIYNSGFRFTENKTDNLVISKDVLVDRGTWRGNIKNVFNMSGSFMSQSRYIDGKWYIENEISNSDTSESPAGQ